MGIVLETRWVQIADHVTWQNDQVDLLHNLYICISKVLKEATFVYSSSDTILTNLGNSPNKRKPLIQLWNAVLRGHNAHLTAVQKHDGGTRLRLNFSRIDMPSERNVLFTTYFLRAILKGKDYCTLDMVFPFVAAFIYCATGLVEQAPKTRLHTMCSDLLSTLTGYDSNGMAEDVRLGQLRRHIKDFKLLLKAILHQNCTTGLYSLNFHLLYLVVEDPEHFGCLQGLDASPSERPNVHLKQAYRTTSQRWGWGMVETGGDMDTRTEMGLRRTHGMGNVKISLKDRNWIHIEWSGSYLAWDEERTALYFYKTL